MIITHQHFSLLEKCILERIVFIPPIKKSSVMENEACFLYSVNGQSSLYSANQKMELSSKDGVVLKCGSYLQNHYKSSDDKPYEKIAIHFHPEVLKLIYKDDLPEFLKNRPSKNIQPIERIKVDKMIGQYIDSLIFYFESPSLVNDELVVLKVKELLLLLIKTDSSEQIQNILKDLFNPTEVDFKKIIQAHLYSNLTITDLSLLSNLSVSTFKRTFRQIYNDSPAHYIKVKRLEKSAELLKITSDRISDIGYDCGFNTIGHFSKSFIAHFQMSPSDYRETH
jgi:AraC-like DNA-binding protein